MNSCFYYHNHSMKKIFLLLFSLFFIAVLSHALQIKGEVRALDGEPVAEAVVLHRLSQKKAVTDSHGFFSLDVPDAGRIKLEIIHPDFIEQEVVITRQDFAKKLIVKLMPLIRQKEEVVVTALRYPELSTTVPAAVTIIPRESIEEKMAPNITEGIQNLPGLSSIGSGGFSVVPNIRGLARGRVLIMVDNARVTSDRRTGPNASFVDPGDIEKIEILRSPSSVFYGSDAIGGVIHIFTLRPPMQDGLRGRVNLKYGTVNQEKGLGLSLQGKKGSTGFILSLRGTDAESYFSPLGKVLQSQFTSTSFLGKVIHQTEKREVSLSFLGSRGFNIGKPNQDSDTKPTWYPREVQNLFQFHWLEKEVGHGGDLSFHFFIDPNFLDTKNEKITTYKENESFSRTQSLDFGFQLSYGKVFSPGFRLNGGLDFFGRFGVKAENKNTYFTPDGNVANTTEELPFTEGRREDWGVFLSFDYAGIKNLDVVGGIRLDFLRMKAMPGNIPPVERNTHRPWTGFLGASVKLTEQIVAFVNLSKAYRAPSLNERFYTGISGRGFIIGNPDLLPETSLNVDAGLKFIRKRHFLGLYLFHYMIDDMVERYLIQERTYTYGNIERGQIQGVELEAEYYPVPGWKLFGNMNYFQGVSKVTEQPLNDIPSLRVFLGTRVWKGRFWGEMNATFQQEKSAPGPAEIAIAGYQIVNIQTGYLINSTVHVYFSVSNLLNITYIPRPDPEAMEAPGRNFVLGLHYSF